MPLIWAGEVEAWLVHRGKVDVGHGNHASLATMGRMNLTDGGSLGCCSTCMAQTAHVGVGHCPGLFAKVHPLRISRLVELWSHQAEGSLLGIETDDF